MVLLIEVSQAEGGWSRAAQKEWGRAAVFELGSTRVGRCQRGGCRCMDRAESLMRTTTKKKRTRGLRRERCRCGGELGRVS